MITLAAYIAGTSGLLGFLIHLLVIAIVIGLFYWILTLIPLPPPVKQILNVILVVVAVIFLICLLLGLSGCVTNPLTGKKELSPEAKTFILQVAQAEAHQLANSYLTTGNVDFKKDLIAGGLSQVYTLDGTPTPITQTIVGQAVGNVIANPALKDAVAKAAVNTIAAAPAGTAKATAINEALGALDVAIAQAVQKAAAP